MYNQAILGAMARGGRRGWRRVHQAAPDEIEQPPARANLLITSDSIQTASHHQLTNGTVHAAETQFKTSIPSYASMVDPNEDTALDYVPVNEINGIKCAKIVTKDIEEEVVCWKNAVICCVLGATPHWQSPKGM